MENNVRAFVKKGSTPSVPGFSCKDILISGEAPGDGEYWIDPASSGDPFRVFCDMTTDQGTLEKRSTFKNLVIVLFVSKYFTPTLVMVEPLQ